MVVLCLLSCPVYLYFLLFPEFPLLFSQFEPPLRVSRGGFVLPGHFSGPFPGTFFDFSRFSLNIFPLSPFSSPHPTRIFRSAASLFHFLLLFASLTVFLGRLSLSGAAVTGFVVLVFSPVLCSLGRASLIRVCELPLGTICGKFRLVSTNILAETPKNQVSVTAPAL